MNAKALRQAVKRAEREIEAYSVFDMSSWAKHIYKNKKQSDLEKEPCGTACCLAGFSIPLKRVQTLLRNGKPEEIEWEAMDALEITREQASRLFHTGGWPFPFYDAYYAAAHKATVIRVCTKKRLKAERAKVAVLKARVEHFIATEGRE